MHDLGTGTGACRFALAGMTHEAMYGRVGGYTRRPGAAPGRANTFGTLGTLLSSTRSTMDVDGVLGARPGASSRANMI